MPDRSDILLTLFNTLTKAFERTEKVTDRLATQQNELVNHINNLPIEDLGSMLKEHNKQSGEDIGTCTEEVKAVDSKVSKMIAVVIAVTSIFSIALLIVMAVIYFNKEESSVSAQDITDSHNVLIESLEERFREQQDEEHIRLKQDIVKTIREEFRKQKENGNTTDK